MLHTKRIYHSQNGAVSRIVALKGGEKLYDLRETFIPTRTPIQVQYIIPELSGVQICPDTYPIYQRCSRNFSGQRGRTTRQ